MKRPLGCVSEEWATSQGIPIETGPIVTVNANGFVGATFVRRERCIIHDDVMVIEVLAADVDPEYLEIALRSAIAAGNYEYEAKLYSRVQQLSVDIPWNGTVFDLERQRQIAATIKRFDTLQARLAEMGQWAKSPIKLVF
jgi:type I restriction enzyme M protein